MTEEEAKNKWCPFARAEAMRDKADSPRLAINRGSPIFVMMEATLCIGSACMAWRAVQTGWTNPNPAGESEPIYGSGYCGLAGKP